MDSLSRPQNAERAERRRTHRGMPRVGLAVILPRTTRRPSSFHARASLSATSPSTLSSPWPRSPSPHLLPRARAEQSRPAAGAPTNLGRRSSIPRTHGPLTSPSTSSSLLELTPAFSRPESSPRRPTAIGARQELRPLPATIRPILVRPLSIPRRGSFSSLSSARSPPYPVPSALGGASPPAPPVVVAPPPRRRPSSGYASPPPGTRHAWLPCPDPAQPHGAHLSVSGLVGVAGSGCV